MCKKSKFRFTPSTTLAAALLCFLGYGGGVGLCSQVHPKPKLFHAPAAAHPPGNPKNQNPHLEQWMERNRALTPEQQQKALDNEPGFRDLPPQMQQRLHERLAQLNAMPPEQRSRMLEGAEAMEHLTPEQRQQVNGALAQLGTLPSDRRTVVVRAWRELRTLPPAQRQAVLSSDRYRGQFSPEERGTLNNLLTVAPLIPPPPAH